MDPRDHFSWEGRGLINYEFFTSHWSYTFSSSSSGKIINLYRVFRDKKQHNVKRIHKITRSSKPFFFYHHLLVHITSTYTPIFQLLVYKIGKHLDVERALLIQEGVCTRIFLSILILSSKFIIQRAYFQYICSF